MLCRFLYVLGSGLYYTKTNKTWKDNDLAKGYDFGKKIYFKKNCKPDGVPILYILKTKWSNIIINNNFPFEMKIVDDTPVKIINDKKECFKKIKNSEKLLKYYEIINLSENNLQIGGDIIISLKQPWIDLIKSGKKTVE